MNYQSCKYIITQCAITLQTGDRVLTSTNKLRTSGSGITHLTLPSVVSGYFYAYTYRQSTSRVTSISENEMNVRTPLLYKCPAFERNVKHFSGNISEKDEISEISLAVFKTNI